MKGCLCQVSTVQGQPLCPCVVDTGVVGLGSVPSTATTLHPLTLALLGGSSRVVVATLSATLCVHHRGVPAKGRIAYCVVARRVAVAIGRVAVVSAVIHSFYFLSVGVLLPCCIYYIIGLTICQPPFLEPPKFINQLFPPSADGINDKLPEVARCVQEEYCV